MVNLKLTHLITQKMMERIKSEQEKKKDNQSNDNDKKFQMTMN